MLVGPLGPERETKHEGRGQMLIVNTPELSKVDVNIPGDYTDHEILNKSG